ncbi:MAG TPA: hypothetical protein VF575_01410 [Candidatus Saccharimonadales bacterium]|jgi:hypothetical protein
MSEKGNHKIFDKKTAQALGTGAILMLVANCGQSGEQQIVSGVPAQIDYKRAQSEYDASNPSLWPTVYYFGLKQCISDIESVKNGLTVNRPSFNLDTHTSDPGCFVKRTEVSASTYNKFNENATIVFSGKTGEPIGPIG